MAKENSKIIITGALGHIGSYVARDLAVRFPGVEIVLIDSMLTQRYASLFNLPSIGNFRFHELDISKAELRPLLQGAHVVIHLAAITDAAGSFGRAAEVEQNNYQCTARLAEICAETGTRLVALSSTSVYGTQAEIVSEDCSSAELKPQSPYAETKLREEELVSSLATAGRLRAVLLRFGTIFGVSPGMRFHTAVNKFCWQAVMKMPLSVWRTAYHQKRPYLDLIDASRALAHIIERDIFDGRIYNVLTLNATVCDIVESIQAYVPDLEVAFVDNKIMNQLSYEVSCERFQATGFHFAGNLCRGVGETISLLRAANGRPA